MGLVRVPFASMILFSTTWGMGLIGAANIMIVKTINTEYEILSKNFNMVDDITNMIYCLQIFFKTELTFLPLQ